MSMLTPAQLAALSLRFATAGSITSIAEGLGEVSEETRQLAILVDEQLGGVVAQVASVTELVNALNTRVTALNSAVNALTQDVNQLKGAVGDVRFINQVSPIPSGWLKCDGSAVSASAYPALYALITNLYGGDATQFNLPNYVSTFGGDPIAIIKAR